MNVRVAVHLAVSMVLGLALVFTGLAWNPLGIFVGLVVWYPVEQLIRALLPLSYLSAPRGTQATAGAHQDWAMRLVASFGLHPSRTPAGDAARLASGIPLGFLVQANRDGRHVQGFLVLARTGDGTTVAWRPGRKAADQPIAAPVKATVQQGRVQEVGVMARMRFTVSVKLGGNAYWVRPQDAELLGLVLPPSGAPVGSAESSVTA